MCIRDSARPQQEVLTVSQVTALIKEHLESNFSRLWLEGEISNFKHHSSGHMYFTLKDKESQISAVMFKGSNLRLRFKPEDGMKVLVFGRISVYEPRGSYQVYVQEMEPKGIGDLQLAFEQLKRKLEADGLFSPEHKKKIPEFPEVIGVVTSGTGAAIRDIQNVITRRFSLARILLIPVRVQGNLAGDEIVKAIEIFNEYGNVDVLIVGRGGGSIEDLWPFNEERVARAIFNSKIPVISAVGHEVDFTISDFVSDLRAPTPSAAAELVVKDKTELAERIRSFVLRSENSMSSDIREKRLTLNQIMKRRVFTQANAPIEEKLLRLDEDIQRMLRAQKHTLSFYEENIKKCSRVILGYSPDKRISEFKMKVLNLEKNIFSFTRSGIRERSLELAEAAGKLEVLSPLSILKRGYSITRKYPAMKIIRSVKEVSEGDDIQVKVKDGNLDCSIKKIIEEKT